MSPDSKFYAIEYWVGGVVDIKHTFLDSAELQKLVEMLNSHMVKYEIHCLSRSNIPEDLGKSESISDVDSLNGIIMGLSIGVGDRGSEPTE